MSRGACLVLLLLSMFLPSATAGTAADPEVLDPAGDVEAGSLPIPAGTLPHADAVDVVAGWVSMQDPSTLAFTVQVTDLGSVETLGNDPDADFRWGIRFETPGADPDADYWARTWMAHSTFNGLIYGGGWGHQLWDPRVEEYVPASGTVDVAAGTLTVIVPLEMLDNVTAGSVLSAISADAGHYWPTYPVWLGDWAAKGRDFAIPAADLPLAPPTEGESDASESMPGLGLALLGAALVACVLAVRRRA